MEIDLKLLQYTVVLSKHRHFGRAAAAALRISQPPLSHNIAALQRSSACATRHVGIGVLVATSVPGPRTAAVIAF